MSYIYNTNSVNIAKYKFHLKAQVDRASSEAIAMQRPFVSVICQLFLDSNTRSGVGIGEIC